MAVYTAIDQQQLAVFLAEYEIGEVQSYTGIAEGVENSNYRVETTSGTYILTIYEKRVRRDDLPFFLGLMEHLAAAGVPAPTPVHGRDGTALREIDGKAAAIVTYLDGAWPRKPRPEHCQELGAAMARMHLAGADYGGQRQNDLSVESWGSLFADCVARADEVAHGLGREIGEELAHLEANWPRGLPGGVIHADLFPDNVFFRGNSLSGIIDFYFACNDCFAYELAICLNAWCFEDDGSFNITKAKLMLNAYRSVRPFSYAEVESLPLLARGAAMRFLLTRLHDWLHQVDGALVRPKNPLEYLARLRFHRGVAGPKAYGLA
jgi:homoserine kinase type II